MFTPLLLSLIVVIPSLTMNRKTLATKYWRYYLPPNLLPVADHNRDSWSIVYVDNIGLLAVVSDHGSFSHFWGTGGRIHSDFRRELLRFNPDYVRRKLSYDLADVFDGVKTQKIVRELIVDRRRGRSMSRESAAQDWEDAKYIDDNPVNFSEFLDGRRGRWALYLDASSTRKHNQSGLEHWSTISFLRLQAVLKEDVAS